jgi:hypothetical protein
VHQLRHLQKPVNAYHENRKSWLSAKSRGGGGGKKRGEKGGGGRLIPATSFAPDRARSVREPRRRPPCWRCSRGHRSRVSDLVRSLHPDSPAARAPAEVSTGPRYAEPPSALSVAASTARRRATTGPKRPGGGGPHPGSSRARPRKRRQRVETEIKRKPLLRSGSASRKTVDRGRPPARQNLVCTRFTARSFSALRALGATTAPRERTPDVTGRARRLGLELPGS